MPNPEDENIFVFRVLQRRRGCHIRKHVNPNLAKAKSCVKVQQKSKKINYEKRDEGNIKETTIRIGLRSGRWVGLGEGPPSRA